MSFRPRNREPWKESQPLDVTYDKEQRRTEGFEAKWLPYLKPTPPKGDSFDAFCRQQARRISRRLERAATRITQSQPEEEQFESRKS